VASVQGGYRPLPGSLHPFWYGCKAARADTTAVRRRRAVCPPQKEWSSPPLMVVDSRPSASQSPSAAGRARHERSPADGIVLAAAPPACVGPPERSPGRVTPRNRGSRWDRAPGCCLPDRCDRADDGDHFQSRPSVRGPAPAAASADPPPRSGCSGQRPPRRRARSRRLSRRGVRCAAVVRRRQNGWPTDRSDKPTAAATHGDRGLCRAFLPEGGSAPVSLAWASASSAG